MPFCIANGGLTHDRQGKLKGARALFFFASARFKVPSSATCPKSFENSGFSGFSFAFGNRFFVGRRIIEIVDFYIIHFFQGSASAKRNGPAEAGPDNS